MVDFFNQGSWNQPHSASLIYLIRVITFIALHWLVDSNLLLIKSNTMPHNLLKHLLCQTRVPTDWQATKSARLSLDYYWAENLQCFILSWKSDSRTLKYIIIWDWCLISYKKVIQYLLPTITNFQEEYIKILHIKTYDRKEVIYTSQLDKHCRIAAK